MGSIFVDRNVSMPLNIGSIKCCVWFMLTYGCEEWPLTADLEKQLEAIEMWFLKRMLEVTFIDQVSIEEVLRRVRVKSKPLFVIIERHAGFLGHVIREKALKYVAQPRRVEEKRALTHGILGLDKERYWNCQHCRNLRLCS